MGSKQTNICYLFRWSERKTLCKAFLIENENREDVFISSMLQVLLEIVSTDWRPVAKLSFAKDRGKDRREDQIY